MYSVSYTSFSCSLISSKHDSTHLLEDYRSVSEHTQWAHHPKFHSSTWLSDTAFPSLCLLPAAHPTLPCPPPSIHGCPSTEAPRRPPSYCGTVSQAFAPVLFSAWIDRAATRDGWSNGEEIDYLTPSDSVGGKEMDLHIDEAAHGELTARSARGVGSGRG
jgi:hypothetical protein